MFVLIETEGHGRAGHGRAGIGNKVPASGASEVKVEGGWG